MFATSKETSLSFALKQKIKLILLKYIFADLIFYFSSNSFESSFFSLLRETEDYIPKLERISLVLLVYETDFTTRLQ